jgi:outer membrane murein-binding lipoprotein Lpp
VDQAVAAQTGGNNKLVYYEHTEMFFIQEVKRLAFLKRFMLILALLICGLLLTGCSDSAENSDVSDDIDEILEDELPAEDEPEDPEALQEDEEAKESSGTSSTGASFKHEVKMDVDGVIEKDQGEQWWVMD